ncbi:MAG: aldo/keto reductase [Candidatus Dormibacteria bacterium]
MERRRVGAAGPEVTVIGLGTNNFGSRMDWPAVSETVAAALAVGINLFDTAASYGQGESERRLGRALRGRREQAVIATKFGWPAGRGPNPHPGSPAELRRSAEASLERLGVEQIDLLQIHFPDPNTPIAETLGGLQELVAEGKVAHIGSSNFTPTQIEDGAKVATDRGLAAFISSQEEYSLLQRDIERETIPLLARLGLGLLPYFPLASGMLTGKYRWGEPAPAGSRLDRPEADPRLRDRPTFEILEAVADFADTRGASMLEVAIGFLLRQPVVSSVIAGATSPDQVRANVAAAGWRPSSDDLVELDRITARVPDRGSASE